MKKLFVTFALLSCFLIASAVEVGKTYRISPKSYPSKSLFIKNSLRDASVDVMLWEETDVPSQQWTLLEGDDGTYVLQNVYSKLYAAPRTKRTGGTLYTHRVASYGRIALEAVDESAGIYHILSIAQDLYLSASTGENGDLPLWGEKDEASESQLWVFQEVEPKATFTAAMRDEMVDNYLKAYCKSKGSSMRTFSKGGWGEAEQLEVLLDAYESTGNETYLNNARYVYNYFKSQVGDHWNRLVYTDDYKWYGHDFNDDVMWQIIAVARLGWLTGTKSYTTAAKNNFDKIYERAYIPFTGLMRWAESSGDAYGTNSCIAGPTEVAACYLGMSGCGEEYFEKARDLYAAQRYTLANNMATGKVWDSVVWDPNTKTVKSKNEWASTYNQGTMLGAACLLYEHYGDEQYLKDAKKLMDFTKKNLCTSYGLINVCQDESNGDLCGFKGILMRYVRRFVLDLNQPDYQEWLMRNALLAYCNRSANGLTGTGWLTKATDASTTNPFGCSTAVSAAVNVPLWEVVKNGFDTLQAERFDYHRGLLTTEEAGCGQGAVAQVSNGSWAQYDNVDFGEQTARSMSLDVTAPVSNATGTVEVYFDKMEGTPAGVFELKELDEAVIWHSLLVDITPTTGLHRVYLRFTCTTSRSKAYRVDSFRFFVQTAEEVRTGISAPSLTTQQEPMITDKLYNLKGMRLPQCSLRGSVALKRGRASRVIIK